MQRLPELPQVPERCTVIAHMPPHPTMVKGGLEPASMSFAVEFTETELYRIIRSTGDAYSERWPLIRSAGAQNDGEA